MVKTDLNNYSPLVLAYIGDSVYDLYVRTRLALSHRDKVSNLHSMATKYVCAEAQYRTFHEIEGELTDEELRIYKRGRNAKSSTTPKNADVVHYRHATGFEALLGWLYLGSNTERLEYLLDKAFKTIKNGG